MRKSRARKSVRKSRARKSRARKSRAKKSVRKSRTKKSVTKKKERQGPSVSATKVEIGTKMRGNDGNMWECKAFSREGKFVPRWVRLG